jgi:hypothetical protein
MNVSEERTASILKIPRISKQTTSRFLHYYPEDSDSNFDRKVGELLLDYTVSYPRI